MIPALAKYLPWIKVGGVLLMLGAAYGKGWMDNGARAELRDKVAQLEAVNADLSVSKANAEQMLKDKDIVIAAMAQSQLVAARTATNLSQSLVEIADAPDTSLCRDAPAIGIAFERMRQLLQAGY